MQKNEYELMDAISFAKYASNNKVPHSSLYPVVKDDELYLVCPNKKVRLTKQEATRLCLAIVRSCTNQDWDEVSVKSLTDTFGFVVKTMSAFGEQTVKAFFDQCTSEGLGEWSRRPGVSKEELKKQYGADEVIEIDAEPRTLH